MFDQVSSVCIRLWHVRLCFDTLRQFMSA